MDASYHCRFCTTLLNKSFIDLGKTPLSNLYLSKEDLNKHEAFYPLHARICESCLLVQLPEVETPENIFSNYAYFSSYSDSWLTHSSDYTDMMIERFSIDPRWQVVEIASNDGYLLQYFQKKNIPILGIEPAQNVAKIALEKGIPTQSVFFSANIATQLVQNGKHADLVIANNVLAHVPNLNDFISGLKILLAPQGVLTIEFPHLLRLIEHNQFDTIYHEHFSYFSLLTILKIFSKHDLSIFDVEELATHGGSLRIFVKHQNDHSKKISNNVSKIVEDEKLFGLNDINHYQQFSNTVMSLKKDLLTFLRDVKNSGKKIAGYGAPAKGNTLLNFFEITNDLLSFTVDRNIFKQGKYLPGTRIPILPPDEILVKKPDYLLILPWNLKSEIIHQMNCVREWNGKFVVPIPRLEIF